MNQHRRWQRGRIVAALLLVFLVLRLVWVICRSESGIHPHLDVWRSALPLPNQVPLAERDPVEQAEFWLDELLVKARSTEDPEVATGIAWMLDAPQLGFARRHLRVRPGDFDVQIIDDKMRPFHDRCDAACLQAMDHAIRLDPTRLDSYRNKGLLLFRMPCLRLTLEPRSATWLAQLDELKSRDPGNGLYDYLAAGCLWQSAIQAEFDERWDEMAYQILDRKRLDESTKRLEAANGSAFLQVARNSYPATLKVLRGASVPRADHAQTLRDRRISNKQIGMLFGVLGRVRRMSEYAESRDEFQAWKEEQERLSGMLARCGEMHDADKLTQAHLQAHNQYSLWKLQGMQEDLFDPDAGKRFRQSYFEAAHAREVMGEVADRLARRQVAAQPLGARIAAIQTVGFAIAPDLVVLASIGVLVAMLTMRLTRPSDSGRTGVLDVPRLHPLKQALILSGALLVTFVVCGMIPAGVFASDAPSGSANSPVKVDGFPALSKAIYGKNKLVWSMVQWQANFGPAIMVGIWLIVMSFLIWLRQRREEVFSNYFLTHTDHAFGIARMIRRSAATVAIFASVLYAAAAPQLTQVLDAQHTLTIDLLMRRSEVILPLIAEVRNDAEAMEGIRQRAEEGVTEAEETLAEELQEDLD